MILEPHHQLSELRLNIAELKAQPALPEVTRPLNESKFQNNLSLGFLHPFIQSPSPHNLSHCTVIITISQSWSPKSSSSSLHFFFLVLFHSLPPANWSNFCPFWVKWVFQLALKWALLAFIRPMDWFFQVHRAWAGIRPGFKWAGLGLVSGQVAKMCAL